MWNQALFIFYKLKKDEYFYSIFFVAMNDFLSSKNPQL